MAMHTEMSIQGVGVHPPRQHLADAVSETPACKKKYTVYSHDPITKNIVVMCLHWRPMNILQNSVSLLAPSIPVPSEWLMCG
jgi:hypothetical protein